MCSLLLRNKLPNPLDTQTIFNKKKAQFRVGFDVFTRLEISFWKLLAALHWSLPYPVSPSVPPPRSSVKPIWESCRLGCLLECPTTVPSPLPPSVSAPPVCCSFANRTIQMVSSLLPLWATHPGYLWRTTGQSPWPLVLCSIPRRSAVLDCRDSWFTPLSRVFSLPLCVLINKISSQMKRKKFKGQNVSRTHGRLTRRCLSSVCWAIVAKTAPKQINHKYKTMLHNN